MNEWMAEARCANLGMTDKAVLDLFYPDTGSRKSPREVLKVYRRAMRVCALCPVRKDCLEAALSYEEGRRVPLTGKWSRRNPEGVWGGHMPKERHRREITHLQGCACSAPYPGCRPIPDRITLLEELFEQKRYKLLTEKERKKAS